MDGFAFTLLGFPRQGTDFLMGCVTPGFLYHKEYFNPMCNPRIRKSLKGEFGSEGQFKKDIFKRPNEEKFLSMFSDWSKNFKMNKEVFSFRKSDLFSKYSHVIYLFRNHKQTFPSSRPNYIIPIYESFMEEEFEEGSSWSEVKKFISKLNVKDPKEKQVLIHAASWFLQVSNAERPILNYEFLMQSNKENIESKITAIMPEWINCKAAAERIVQRRRFNPSERLNRWLDFSNGTDVEKKRQKLISFMESLNIIDLSFLQL